MHGRRAGEKHSPRTDALSLVHASTAVGPQPRSELPVTGLVAGLAKSNRARTTRISNSVQLGLQLLFTAVPNSE
jgi:hypothetical protein